MHCYISSLLYELPFLVGKGDGFETDFPSLNCSTQLKPSSLAITVVSVIGFLCSEEQDPDLTPGVSVTLPRPIRRVFHNNQKEHNEIELYRSRKNGKVQIDPRINREYRL